MTKPNKYDSAATFVPAIPVGQQQWREPQTIDVVPIPQTDITPVMRSGSNASRDSVSAQDRAKGFERRMVLPMALTVVMGLAGALFWTMTLALLDVGEVAPYMLDRILIFLAIVGGFGLLIWSRANGTDYEHSQSGVERLRITEATEIRRLEVAAELKQRENATAAMLAMLESRDQGMIGVDHER